MALSKSQGRSLISYCTLSLALCLAFDVTPQLSMANDESVEGNLDTAISSSGLESRPEIKTLEAEETISTPESVTLPSVETELPSNDNPAQEDDLKATVRIRGVHQDLRGKSGTRILPSDESDTRLKTRTLQFEETDPIPGIVTLPWEESQFSANVSPAKKDSDDVSAQVRALRQDVRRLSQLLERQLAETERLDLAKQKTAALTHQLEGPRSLMLYFTASWCGPCQKMGVLIEHLKREGFPIRTVDVDLECDLAKEYKVTSIPLVITIYEGKVCERVTGIVTERRLREMLTMQKVGSDKVRVVKEYQGGVSDRALQSLAPASEIVTDAETWKVLCNAWNIVNQAEVDFTRQFIILKTTEGSRISLQFNKEPDGNLNVDAAYTTDYLSHGFHYLAILIDRDGIESINRKRLPTIQSTD